MFAEIDVQIDWREHRDCLAGAIRVTIQMFTSPHQLPGALAYALPYEGTHIVVFYDRVQHTASRQVRALTAHVMAHEIAHILEGIKRHSQSGLMKAYWEDADLAQMARKPLPFTDQDIMLIHNGLKVRANRLRALEKPP
jgi:hypothetical protein